jgi:hypothetical protein
MVEADHVIILNITKSVLLLNVCNVIAVHIRKKLAEIISRASSQTKRIDWRGIIVFTASMYIAF